MRYRLRDLSNHEKGENQRLQKQLDIHKSEASSLGKERDKMAANLQQLEEEVIELKEQVRGFPRVLDFLQSP